eukprot:scaffold76832_cov58-Phaeocystis_antarctica.AAC.5
MLAQERRPPRELAAAELNLATFATFEVAIRTYQLSTSSNLVLPLLLTTFATYEVSRYRPTVLSTTCHY